jgi:hypothetical protein
MLPTILLLLLWGWLIRHVYMHMSMKSRKMNRDSIRNRNGEE